MLHHHFFFLFNYWHTFEIVRAHIYVTNMSRRAHNNDHAIVGKSPGGTDVSRHTRCNREIVEESPGGTDVSRTTRSSIPCVCIYKYKYK